MSDTTAPKEVAEAGTWAARLGFAHAKEHGARAAFDKSLGEVKSAISGVAEQGRVKGFARVGAVGVGSYIAFGALKSKDSDGNDRSALSRMGHAVIGGGLVAAGALAHGRG